MESESVLLLLLVGLSSLLVVIVSGNEHVVACQKGAFPQYFNNETQEFKRHWERSDQCNATEISQLCRKSFHMLSCGIPLNETMLSEDGHAGAVFWSVSKKSDGTTVIEFDKYLCDGYRRAREYNLTGQMWTDRLVVAEDQMPLLDVQWFRHVITECGQTPRSYSFGSACGVDIHLEMVFVCERPKPDFDLGNSDRTLSAHDRDHSQFFALDRYAEVAEQLTAAKAAKDFRLADVLERKLANLLESIQHGAKAQHLVSGRLTEPDTMTQLIFSTVGAKIYSRAKTIERYKIVIHKICLERSNDLLYLAAGYLTNKTNLHGAILKKYNVENVEAKFVDAIFPEIANMTRQYYLDFCRNNTLGISRHHLEFLNLHNAHVKLNFLYRDIFNSSRTSRKFLPRRKETIHVALIAAVLVTSLLLGGLLYFGIQKLRFHKRKLQQQEQDEEYHVFFSNNSTVTPEAEENPYSMEPSAPSVKLVHSGHLLKQAPNSPQQRY